MRLLAFPMLPDILEKSDARAGLKCWDKSLQGAGYFTIRSVGEDHVKDEEVGLRRLGYKGVMFNKEETIFIWTGGLH